MKKEILVNLRKGLMFASAIGVSGIFMSGCEKDTRIDNIEQYYLLRIADESGTKTDVVYTYPEIFELINANDAHKFFSISDGSIVNYSERYYENGADKNKQPISPVQLIPYTDILKKDTYYEENVKNNEENQTYISLILENYEFPTKPNYKFKDQDYSYECHFYKLENHQTEEVSYVIGYPMIAGETNPTQIYNALDASFLYLGINEDATLIPSDLEKSETFTLDEAREILKQAQENEQGMSLELK